MKKRLLIVVLLILSFTMLFLFPLTIIASEQDLIKESLNYLEKQDYRSAAYLLEEVLSSSGINL